jgi:hypothetical protein
MPAVADMNTGNANPALDNEKGGCRDPLLL